MDICKIIFFNVWKYFPLFIEQSEFFLKIFTSCFRKQCCIVKRTCFHQKASFSYVTTKTVVLFELSSAYQKDGSTIAKIWNLPANHSLMNGYRTFTHKGTTLIHKKEWQPVICSKIEGTGRRHAEWNQSNLTKQVSPISHICLNKSSLSKSLNKSSFTFFIVPFFKLIFFIIFHNTVL